MTLYFVKELVLVFTLAGFNVNCCIPKKVFFKGQASAVSTELPDSNPGTLERKLGSESASFYSKEKKQKK